MAPSLSNNLRNLSARDRAIIWHPCTQHLIDPHPIPIVRAQGAHLFSDKGDRYIDATSSWWSNLHGHSHPYIAKKLAEQAQTLEHVMFADYTHEPAILLAERLQPLLPGPFKRFFYSDNGSTAVEVALKIAFQYWHNQDPGHPKHKVVALQGGYHGDTFGAMSAAGKSPFNKPFWPLLFDVEFIDPPQDNDSYNNSLEQMKMILEKDDVACFIFEPLVQGVAGMVLHSAQGLSELMKLCRQHQVLLIADEVMTGFGRTGSLFACQQLSEVPDIMCLSKGLTGGTLPLSLTVCREFIYEQFLSSERSKALLHSHTFTANPLGCAAGLASLDLLLTSGCDQKRKEIELSHLAFKNKYENLWKRCEVLGTILALEYNTVEQAGYFNPIRDRLSRFFLERRVVIRPFGDSVHVMPPYCISQEDLNTIYKCLIESLECI